MTIIVKGAFEFLFIFFKLGILLGNIIVYIFECSKEIWQKDDADCRKELTSKRAEIDKELNESDEKPYDISNKESPYKEYIRANFIYSNFYDTCVFRRKTLSSS